MSDDLQSHLAARVLSHTTLIEAECLFSIMIAAKVFELRQLRDPHKPHGIN